MGTVGQDFGEYRSWLEAHNIDASTIMAIEDDFTASCFCSTDRENNQIVNFYTGAMAKASLLSFKDQDTRSIDWVVISPNDPGAMVQYVRECREMELPYMYDPSQQIVRLSGDELREGIGGAAVFIVNEYEFGMVQKKTGLALDEIEASARTVIVTHGDEGSVIISDGARYEIPIVRPQTIADPTGVGDGYRAGILKGIIHGCPWPVAGRLGSLVAAYVLEKHGTQNHVFSRREFVQRFRKEFGEHDSYEDALQHIMMTAEETNQ
jgi:adenosine kinase